MTKAILLLKAHPVAQGAQPGRRPRDASQRMVALLARRGGEKELALLSPGEPMPEEAASGKYRKPVIVWRGLRIRIESPAGSVRRGTNRDGVSWEVRLKFDYGEVEGSMGVDGDPVDIVLGPDLDAPFVYVVHQRKVNRWDEYDEDKCMVGFASEADATAAFLSNYNDPRFLGPVTTMEAEVFVTKVLATANKPVMIKAFDDRRDFGTVLFLRAHVDSYVKTDGTMVHAHEDKRPAARPMYASRKLKNAHELHAWATAIGFTNLVPPDKMHSTVAYSKTPVHHAAVATDPADMSVPAGEHMLTDTLGDKGGVVLAYEHGHMRARHHAILGHGATWDGHGSYQPHVTLSYGPQPHLDWRSIKPYSGALHFGPESVEDLKEGWRPVAKAHVGPYMRRGKMVNLSGYEGAAAQGKPAPGQMALFVSPVKKKKTEPAADPPAAPLHPIDHAKARIAELSEAHDAAVSRGDHSMANFYAGLTIPAFKRELAALESAFAAHAKDGDGTELSNTDGRRHAVLLPDASSPGKYRYQTFDARGFSHHSTHDTPELAIADAAREGYTQHNPGILEKLAGTDAWAHGMAINAVMQAHNEGLIDFRTAMDKIKAIDAEHTARAEPAMAKAWAWMGTSATG